MLLSDDHDIARLAPRLIDTSLPKAEWTHAGHFAAALWLCRHRPDLAAPDPIRSLIRRYNEAIGTANTDTAGYHHTITLASMRAARACLARHPADAAVHVVLRSLLASELGDPAWLLAFWSKDLLFSPQARRMWCEPDLKILTF